MLWVTSVFFCDDNSKGWLWKTSESVQTNKEVRQRLHKLIADGEQLVRGSFENLKAGLKLWLRHKLTSSHRSGAFGQPSSTCNIKHFQGHILCTTQFAMAVWIYPSCLLRSRLLRSLNKYNEDALGQGKKWHFWQNSDGYGDILKTKTVLVNVKIVP